MFCNQCGTPVKQHQAFCGNCGSRLAESSPTPAVPVADPRRQRICEWCRAEIDDPAQSACFRCGATLTQAPISTASGWTQLPARKDMAKLQFGNSSCQIEGLYVPVADVNLAPGDSVYFSHHVLLWRDPGVVVSTMPLKGAWKRMFAGLPLIMTQASGPGHIAFSKDDPGELIPVPLEPGQSIDVREHMLLAATANIAYDWFQTGIWFQSKNGDETETHYPVGCFMDRFSAATAQPGLLLLHGGGNIFVRDLAPGQTILVKPTALVFKDPSVSMQLHFESPQSRGLGWANFSWSTSWGARYLWLRLAGPGRVAIQSVFEPIHEGTMTSSSSATAAQW